MARSTICIRRDTDLGEGYRKQFDDIIKAALPFLEDNGRITFSLLRDVLWKHVFHPGPEAKWNTQMPVQRSVSSEHPKPGELRVTVGEFIQTLPPSKCALRRAKGNDCNLPPPVPARRAGAPACLQARKFKQRHDVEFFWCDSMGKGADPKYIECNDGVPAMYSVFAKIKALLRADTVQETHTKTWNMDYAAYLMRLRLVRILQDPRISSDIEHGGRPVYAADADFSGFRKLPRPLTEVIRLTPSTGAERFLLSEGLVVYAQGSGDLKNWQEGNDIQEREMHDNVQPG